MLLVMMLVADWRKIGPLYSLLLIVMLAPSVAACKRASEERSGFPANGSSTLERMRQSGVARVGYANEAPFAYYDTTTHQLTGEAPEVARYVLKQMGVPRIEGVLTEFGALIPGLKARRFDIIAAGMYITPARCRQIAFSEPTYGIGQAFIVKAGNPSNLHSYEDVAAHPTARIGVVAGAIELEYTRAVGIPYSRVMIFPDAPSAVAGVEAGRIDAYAGTSPTIQNLLDKAGNRMIERAAPFTDPLIKRKRARGYGAFGFRKEDSDLLQAFNGHLTTFIGSPQHHALVKRFGFTDADTPGEMTTAQLCALSD